MADVLAANPDRAGRYADGLYRGIRRRRSQRTRHSEPPAELGPEQHLHVQPNLLRHVHHRVQPGLRGQEVRKLLRHELCQRVRNSGFGERRRGLPALQHPRGSRSSHDSDRRCGQRPPVRGIHQLRLRSQLHQDQRQSYLQVWREVHVLPRQRDQPAPAFGCVAADRKLHRQVGALWRSQQQHGHHAGRFHARPHLEPRYPRGARHRQTDQVLVGILPRRLASYPAPDAEHRPALRDRDPDLRSGGTHERLLPVLPASAGWPERNSRRRDREGPIPESGRHRQVPLAVGQEQLCAPLRLRVPAERRQLDGTARWIRHLFRKPLRPQLDPARTGRIRQYFPRARRLGSLPERWGSGWRPG